MKANYDLAEAIRSAIRRDPRSRYRLAKETGLTEAMLSRFMSGQRGLTLRTASKLCEALGLELKATKAKGR